MLKFIQAFFCFLFFINTSNAQYQINLKVIDTKDSILYFRLASFDEKLYIPKDTIKLVNNKANIRSLKPIYGGIYYLYFPNTGMKIQLSLENKDVIYLTINAQLPIDSIQTNDPKNKLFLEYQALENKFQYLDSQYAVLQKKGNATLKIKERLFQEKREALTQFRNTAKAKLDPKLFLYQYLTLLNTIDAYKPDKNKFTEREAFIRSLNLKDQRLYFSPIIKSAIYEYLSAYPLNADSILKSMDVVMKKMDCKDKPYANMFNYFSTVLQNSTIKNNMDGYVKFLDTYLFKNNCSFISKNNMQGYISTYARYKELVMKDTISNIILKDSSGIVQNLRQQIEKYTYTVISFYDPTCEHCQVQIPELDSTLKAIRTKSGLTILHFAICNTSTSLDKEWRGFIQKNKMEEDCVHVMLGDSIEVRNQYAAFGNPMLFLCDASGNILLKKTSVSTIRNYLLSNRH